MADDKPSSDAAAIFFAIKEMAAHPAVVSVADPVLGAKGASVTALIDIQLGNRLRKQGGTLNAVKAIEEVRFDFESSFPATPPQPSLRADFSRNHPHIQPWLTDDGRVVPCAVDGDLGEFVAANGIYGLVSQVRQWLENAARGTLMDPSQGWEPTRRDGYPDFLIADAVKLRGLVDRNGGWKCFRMRYRYAKGPDFTPFFFGELADETNIDAPIGEGLIQRDGTIGRGEGIVIVAWPGKHPNGQPVVCGEYLPDHFRTVGELLARLEQYGTRSQVETAARLIGRRAARQPAKAVFPLPIVNLVRRPYPLIGSQSDVEICGYVAPLRTPGGALTNPADPIRPLAHRQALDPELLRQMSGDKAIEPWALLGCGSLGSKVALHAARSGNAPSVVADKAMLSPHNAARHALYPADAELQLGWLGGKAESLADVLEGLGEKVRVMGDNHAALAEHILTTKGPRLKWLVNTTASMVTREALSQATMAALPRMVDMQLYDAGQVGYLAVEGPGRNPNAVELEAQLYQYAAAKPALAPHLFQPFGGAQQVMIGQGCGSVTIKMSDATLSVMAATMAELFASLDQAAPGALHLLRREGVAITHEKVDVPPFERIDIEGMDGWRVSVAASVQERMRADAALHAKTETGGILVGWSSAIARLIVVTELLDAPPDSVRTKMKFELGTQGVTEQLADIHSRSGNIVRCLGTWHSHLGSAEPSTKDRLSAALVGAGYVQPMVFLILGTDGLRALSLPARLAALDELPKQERRA